MLHEDAQLSVITMQAAAHDSAIPISEYVRKEFFYKCFTSFTKALSAEPALFADVVKTKCLHFDMFFGKHTGKMPLE